MRNTSRSRITCVSVADLSRQGAREALVAWRMGLPAEERAAAERALVTTLLTRLPADPAGLCLGAYLPLRGEPDLLGVLEQWVGGGGTVALPVVVRSDAALEFGRWAPGMAVVRERFGVARPEPFERVMPDLMVVPCVGFDERCFRLGYGGGYYDRTLAAYPCRAIGVAYDGCEIARFEAGEHDIALAEIVTETRLLRAPR